MLDSRYRCSDSVYVLGFGIMLTSCKHVHGGTIDAQWRFEDSLQPISNADAQLEL